LILHTRPLNTNINKLETPSAAIGSRDEKRGKQSCAGYLHAGWQPELKVKKLKMNTSCWNGNLETSLGEAELGSSRAELAVLWPTGWDPPKILLQRKAHPSRTIFLLPLQLQSEFQLDFI
jgi:hypothetical protein